MTEVRLTTVSRTCGRTAAPDAVSMHLPEGAFTILPGTSGSGKTTVLSLITGTAEPTSGRIVVNLCAPGLISAVSGRRLGGGAT